VLDDRSCRELDEGCWPSAATFDPANDLHVDELAGRLLERFRAERDAEAFATLIRVTRDRLLAIARRLAGRLPRSASPSDLVDGALRRLFNDPGQALAPAGSFLVAARGLLEQQARKSLPRGR
jgi:hypothetical protein